MLVVNEVDYGAPRIAVVDVVAKTGGVNHCELDLELLFLEFRLNDVNFCQFVELLVVTAGIVLWKRQLGSEERVNERGLSQARFAYVDAIKMRENTTEIDYEPTTMRVKWAPLLATILCLYRQKKTVWIVINKNWRKTNLVGKIGNANSIGNWSRSRHGWKTTKVSTRQRENQT